MPPEPNVHALADKMTRFAEQTRLAGALSEATNALQVIHELSEAAADIEHDYDALTPAQQADLKTQSLATITALQTYITDMKQALHNTSQALEKLNDVHDAAGAYASTQHAS